MNISKSLLIVACIGLSACGGGTSTTQSVDRSANIAQTLGHHGKLFPLGILQIGPDSFKITQYGQISAGGAAVISLEDGPSSIEEMRVWIGTKDPRGSVKALLTVDGGLFHGHIEVPSTLTDDAKLWVSFKNDADNKVTGSIPFIASAAKSKHDHSSHSGHQH